MSLTFGIAHSWQEAYQMETDPSLFAFMRNFFTGFGWVQLAGELPAPRELATIYNYWPLDGAAPDWKSLLSITLRTPPYVVIPEEGPMMLRKALELLTTHPVGTLTFNDNEGDITPDDFDSVDIVPLKPSQASGNENVYPLRYGGKIRVVFSASWLLWAWSLSSGLHRLAPDEYPQNTNLDILYGVFSSEIAPSAPLTRYEAALVLMTCYVMRSCVPMTFSLR